MLSNFRPCQSRQLWITPVSNRKPICSSYTSRPWIAKWASSHPRRLADNGSKSNQPGQALLRIFIIPGQFFQPFARKQSGMESILTNWFTKNHNAAYSEVFRRVQENRRLTKTSRIEGYGKSLGLVTEEDQQGDVICIVHGCIVPLVLRPLGNELAAHIHMGACYLGDVVDGQAMEINKSSFSNNV
jgi:hypothetical protein